MQNIYPHFPRAPTISLSHSSLFNCLLRFSVDLRNVCIVSYSFRLSGPALWISLDLSLTDKRNNHLHPCKLTFSKQDPTFCFTRKWPRVTIWKPRWKQPLKASRMKSVIYCVCISPELEPLPKIISTYRYVPTLFHLMLFISPWITFCTWLVWTLRHKKTRKLLLRPVYIYSFHVEPTSCASYRTTPPTS